MTKFNRLGEGIVSLDEHYEFLNRRVGMTADEAVQTLVETNFWEIDEAIYWEFLEMLPPLWQTYGGFAFSEASVGAVHAVYIDAKIDEDKRYFCTLQQVSSPRSIDQTRYQVIELVENTPAPSPTS